MYPPIPAFLVSVSSFFSLYFLSAVLRDEPLQVSGASLAGALTIFLFLLFLRVSDEWKDREVDKLLFPTRPLPSGRVLLSDLKVLLGGVCILMVILNIFWTNALLPFLLLFGYGWLMFFYFFIPQIISKSLLWALLTHNPSVLCMNLYVLSISSPFTPTTLLLALLFWLPALAWELSRKIRAPEEETEYQTYSKIFGYRGATLIPLGLFGIHCMAILRLPIPLSIPFRSLLTLTFLVLLLFFLRFLHTPNSKTSKLKPFVEGYMGISSLGLLIELWAQKGVVWAIF